MKRIKIDEVIEYLIFKAKWFLVPFYFKLFWTLIKLMYHFVWEGHLKNEDLVSTLEDVDIVMIANLIKMIITGSYHSFVDKEHNYPDEKLSSGALKVKIVTSTINVVLIHFLQVFIKTDFNTQVIIFGCIVVGGLTLSVIDFMHCKATH